MTTVNSCYWGGYQIRSLIKLFKTYRLSWCLSFWRLSYFYSDRVQLEFKADQDREKIKGSILYNKLFQGDPISTNESFHSSFLSTHVWVISHPSRNQNISLPLSHSVSLQWPAWPPSIDIIFCWNNGNDALISMYLFSFPEWDPSATWDNQMQAMHRMCITM